MRRSAPGREKAFQMAGGRSTGSAEAAQRVVAGVSALPDGDARAAGGGGEGSGRDAGFGGDVFEAAAPCLVLLAPAVAEIDVGVRARGGLPEPGAGQEVPDRAFAAPSGDPGDLARAEPLPGEDAELFCAGGRIGAGRDLGRVAGEAWGAGLRAAASRTWSAVVASLAAMALAGSRARMSGCRSLVVMLSGSGPGQGMPVTQPDGGSQVTGSLMLALDSRELACRRRQRSSCPGMVKTNWRSAGPRRGQLQRPGEVAGVGAGEQLDQAEPGEVLVHRGGGQGGVAGLPALRPGGGVAEEVALAAPAADVELGLGRGGLAVAGGRSRCRGAVLVELAGELADRGRDRFQDAVLAEQGGEGGQLRRGGAAAGRGVPGRCGSLRRSPRRRA